MEQVSRNELNQRKETLDKMLAKFKQLKKESKWSEAWKQLIATMQYANDSLKYSADLLKQIKTTPEQMKEANGIINRISDKISKLGENLKREFAESGFWPLEKPTAKKMLVIPRKQNIH